MTGLAAAWALMAVGVWVTFGFGWGLIVAGAELAAYFLVSYDVDRPLPSTVRTDLPSPLRRFAALPDEEEEAGL